MAHRHGQKKGTPPPKSKPAFKQKQDAYDLDNRRLIEGRYDKIRQLDPIRQQEAFSRWQAWRANSVLSWTRQGLLEAGLISLTPFSPKGEMLGRSFLPIERLNREKVLVRTNEYGEPYAVVKTLDMEPTDRELMSILRDSYRNDPHQTIDAY